MKFSKRCLIFEYLLLCHDLSLSAFVAVPTSEYRVRRALLLIITIQSLYVQRNNVAPSCNHCCCGKAISIAYCECVFVALGFQDSIFMRHIVICGLLVPTVFLIKCTIFEEKKKSCWTLIVCFQFLYNFCLKHFSF